MLFRSKDFVANVSHELRTPVTLIKGFAETLEDGGASVEETARFVAIIRRHADRMASIIDDLLTLARLEAADRRRGAMDGLEPMLLAEVMAGAVDSASLTLEARKASVSVDCPPDIRILAHPGLFEQALVNLLDNAAKYGPEGGVVEMKAVVDRDERFVSVSVLDRGPGVPEKDRPRLFERFYRVDRARSRELGGTGLGLAIVRHIALAHGGDAALRAREGGGSEFILRVPRLVQREDSVQEGSPEGAPEGAPSGESPATSV